MSDKPNLHIDDASSVWSIVEQQLDAFCASWEQAPPIPHIGDFVGDFDPVIRRLILIDLIKVDLEHRWNDGDVIQPIAAYFDAWPELVVDEEVPAELLYEDIYQRRQHGVDVVVNDYLHRYPKSADSLQRLVGMKAADVSTALSHGRLIKEFKVGETIDDFDLRVELGRGAFAIVFLAIQRSMQRLVALKLSANKGTEAQVLSQLDHPNIVRVYDRRIVENQDLQLFYMQYVRGGTLQEALKYVRAFPSEQWNGRLLMEAIDKTMDDHGETIPAPTAGRQVLSESSWEKVTCDFGIQLANALDYAHQKGVLHRDVKPANILLSDEGIPKLADFNISCCSKLDGASPAAYFGGSLAYMSPEQLEAYNPRHAREPDRLDGRSDIYALGVVIWEMLTGSRPFLDEKLGATWETTLEEMTLRRHLGLMEAEWARLPKSCPPALRTFFERSLQPNPAARFQTGSEMARLLRIAGDHAAHGTANGQNSWIQFARRWPWLVMLLASVVPNALAGCFVYFYNKSSAVPETDARDIFVVVSIWLNVLFFSVGGALAVFFTWPLVRMFTAKRHKESLPAAQLSLARRRSLQLGWIAVLCGISEWTLAGLVFPITLTAAGITLGVRGWGDFFFSHALGGLIAGTYPFFMITYAGLVAWYPSLLDSGCDDEREAELLKRVLSTATISEILAASLPMLAVILFAFFPGVEVEFHRRLLLILAVASLLGFGGIFWLSRRIRGRVERLIGVLGPDDVQSKRLTESRHAR